MRHSRRGGLAIHDARPAEGEQGLVQSVLGSSWGLFFSAYAFLAAATMVRHHVSRLLPVIVCLLPLGYLRADPDSPSFPWGAVSFGVIACAWFLSGRWRSRAPLTGSSALRCSVLLVLWSVVSLCANRNWDTGIISIAKLVLALLAFFVFEAEGPSLRRILLPLSIAGAIIALDLMAQDLMGLWRTGHIGQFGHQRPCVNIVANMEAILVAAWLPFLPSLTGRRRMAVLALLGAGGLAIVMAASRQATISLCVILVLWVLRRPGARRQLTILLGAAVLVLALGASTFSLTERFGALLQSLQGNGTEDASAQYRRLAMGMGVEMFLDHPVMGVGPGGYTRESFWYAPSKLLVWRGLTSASELLYTSPHCLYLRVADEVGLPGVLLVAGVLGRVAWLGARRFRRLDPSSEAMGFVLILVPLYLSTLLSDWQFHSPIMWAFLGMASAALRGAAPEADAS